MRDNAKGYLAFVCNLVSFEQFLQNDTTMKTFIIILFCIGLVVTSTKRSKTKERKKRFLTSTACRDVLPNCNAYDSSTCQNANYKQWATKNCARTCNLCPSTAAAPGTGGTGNSGTASGTSSGCVYNSHVYRQGESWRDGCKYTCRCMDDYSGQYTCNTLCLQWNLPSQCHMSPPAPGKCCPTPYCPAGFTINYPPGYTEV